MGAVNISIPAGGEKTPTKEPSKGKHPSTMREPTQTEERANLERPDKEIRDYTTEPHRIPTIEVPRTKTASKVKNQEAQKQSLLKWGDKKNAIKRNGRLPTKRSTQTGGDQTIKYRIQINGYKDTQGTHRPL